MRDLDAQDHLQGATFALKLPVEAASFGEEFFRGAYPSLKEANRFRDAKTTVFRAAADWSYESQNEHKDESGDSVPIDDRLLISQRDIQMYERACDECHSVLTAWGIPHTIETLDPTREKPELDRGLAFDFDAQGGSAPMPRAWSTANALSADELSDEISSAQTLEDLRQRLSDSERESHALGSLELFASRLPSGALEKLGPSFRAFLDLRKASALAAPNAYRSSAAQPTPLSVAAMAQENPPQNWTDSLGRPVLQTIWREIRVALWTVGFEELEAPTQWATLKAEAEAGSFFSGDRCFDNYCLWIERAHALASVRPDLAEANPLSSGARSRLSKASFTAKTPEQEQRLLSASILLDRLSREPDQAVRFAAARSASRL